MRNLCEKKLIDSKMRSESSSECRRGREWSGALIVDWSTECAEEQRGHMGARSRPTSLISNANVKRTECDRSFMNGRGGTRDAGTAVERRRPTTPRNCKIDSVTHRVPINAN
jgi:hypothetical protein